MPLPHRAYPHRALLTGLGALFVLSTASHGASAQNVTSSADPTYRAANPAPLPEAPTPEPETKVDPQQSSGATTSMARATDRIIAPHETAPRLRAGDKVRMGLFTSVTPFAAVGWLATAAYEQGVDEAPNYGQTGKGFAQRLGAAAARDSSENIFSTSIFAPILHEDPRYYRLGRSHGFAARAVYAATRTLISKTDGGRFTPNLSLIGGNLAGAELTQAYYPALNRGLDETMKIFGGSMGGSAVGFLVSEFFVHANRLILIKPAD